MNRWLVLIAVACGCRSTGEPARAAPERSTAAATAPARPAAADAGAGEPKAPEVECLFARSVFCIDGTPTLTALQPPPFQWCPRTQNARQPSIYALDAQFSPAETRARRAAEAQACCYVEFSTMACD